MPFSAALAAVARAEGGDGAVGLDDGADADVDVDAMGATGL